MIKNTENNPLKIRLGLDLDGVIYDFPTEFRNLVAADRGVDPESLASPVKWSFYEDWGMSDEEYFGTMGKAAIQGKVFKDGNIYPQALENVNKLRDLGYEIVIITARHVVNDVDKMNIIKKNTEDWLIKNNVPYDELIIDNDKTRHNLDILIDDNLANIESFVMAGGMAYVFDQPWNRNNTFYSRVNGWNDCVLEMKNIQDMVRSAFAERANANV